LSFFAIKILQVCGFGRCELRDRKYNKVNAVRAVLVRFNYFGK